LSSRLQMILGKETLRDCPDDVAFYSEVVSGRGT
jgi:hypothetical protein